MSEVISNQSAPMFSDGLRIAESSCDPRLKKLVKYCWWILAYTLFVIVWGAYVRATGSGAGCGSHWPLCNGVVIPREKAVETLIEFFHRVTSGLSVIFILGMAYSVFKIHPKNHLARKSAGFSVLFIFQEALIGAGLVLYGLVTHDQSAARAVALGFHLGNTFLLTASISLTALWGAEKDPEFFISQSKQRLLCWGVLALTLMIGVSGAIAALGDTLWPSQGSLVQGFKEDLSSATPILLRLRVIHPFLAVAGGVLLVHYVLSQVVELRLPQFQSAKTMGYVLVVGVFLQMGMGVVNLAYLAPIWGQLTHLLLANLLWIFLVLFVALHFKKLPGLASHQR